MKEFFNSIFGISGKEIKGLSLLILVLVIILLTPRIINYFTSSDRTYLLEDAKTLDSLVVVLEDNGKSGSKIEQLPHATFKFNPNEASVDDFLLLGFDETIAKRIINYRNKGGVFNVKGDLFKIYGVDSALVDRLFPSISLPTYLASKSSSVNTVETQEVKPKRVANNRRPKELPDFDINLADTSMLQTIKGIGSVLSSRIIEFRDNMGGIIDVNQLYEVYNLDTIVADRLINKIYIEASFNPKPLLINEISESELASHPYISWKQARLIIAYRNQHGNFTSAADLLKVYSVDEELTEKITPYLAWTPAN